MDHINGRQRRAWHDITALRQHTRSTTLGVACNHHPWTAHTVGNVGRGMTSPPLDSTHGRMTSRVASHHRRWATHTVEQRRAWHNITAFGKHTRSNDVRRGMSSEPLDDKHERTTSGVTCHHSLWTAHTVKRRLASLDITALRLHARSDEVGRGMTSPPLDSTHSRQSRAWNDYITALGQHTRSAT